MSDERTYTIGDLAEAAGVTPRTIRYYTAEGLLPRPDSRGQYAVYGEEHLLRLQLIARLKEAYLPLSEIRAHLAPLDGTTVRALLEDTPEPPDAEPSGAVDYIAQVLHEPMPPIVAETRAGYQPAPAPTRFQPMAMLPGGDQPKPAMPPPPSNPPAYGFAASAPAEPPAEAAKPESLLRRMLARNRERSAAGEPVEERWRRITVAPGVELHVRDEPALRARVDRLIALAREIFGSDG